MKSGLLAFGALIWTAPLFAQPAPDPLAPLPAARRQAAEKLSIARYRGSDPRNAATPPQLDPQSPSTQATPRCLALANVAVPRDWRGVFDAIDSGNWASAQAGIAALPSSALTPLAKAELYTARGSPVVDLASLQALIAEAPELPAGRPARDHGDQARRADTAPDRPEKPIYGIGSAPYRYKAKPVQGEPYADQLRGLIDPLVKADDAAGAEAQLNLYAPQLSVEARAEAATRVAFIYYVLGQTATRGASPIHGAWARPAIGRARRRGSRRSPRGGSATGTPPRPPFSRSPSSRSSASFAPAAIIGRRAPSRPRRARARSSGLLKAAANTDEAAESFYGLVARETLGLPTRLTADPFIGSDPPIDQYPNVQRAIELAKIGEPGRAEELLRHQAKIGVPTEHHALIQLARRLDLPAAQLWLADNGQWGARSDATDRYPEPVAGGRSTAGVSIPPSPTVISSRNWRSAAPRSARRARSG